MITNCPATHPVSLKPAATAAAYPDFRTPHHRAMAFVTTVGVHGQDVRDRPVQRRVHAGLFAELDYAA